MSFALRLAVALYGTYMRSRPTPHVRRGGTIADLAVRALGGITGPLAAFPGAFLQQFGAACAGGTRWPQRSIYQPDILIMQLLTLGALSLASKRAAVSPEMIMYALPGVAGGWLGLRVFQKLTDVQFHKLVQYGPYSLGSGTRAVVRIVFPRLAPARRESLG